MKLLIASCLVLLFYSGVASAVVVLHVEDLHVVPNGRDQALRSAAACGRVPSCDPATLLFVPSP
jgi:hypothetical protein